MCQSFNASALLELRRSVAANKSLSVEQIKSVIDKVDRQRWQHFEETQCNCWQEAREAAGNPARSKEEEAA